MTKLVHDYPDSTAPDSSGSRPSRGFRTSLDGLSLWDVVQMACLSGIERAVRIDSLNGTGLLFFNDGMLVHATAEAHAPNGSAGFDTRSVAFSGDAAVLEMLAWNGGTVVACDAEWPTELTVETPWQTLLLHAAHQQDEDFQRLSDGVARQSQVSITEDVQQQPPAECTQTISDVAPRGHASSWDGEDAKPAPDESPDGWHVKLDALGAVVEREGGHQELPGCLSHVARLGDLLGELLALGPFEAMEVSKGSATVISYRAADGGLVALEPGNESRRAALRQKLSL